MYDVDILSGGDKSVTDTSTLIKTQSYWFVSFFPGTRWWTWIDPVECKIWSPMSNDITGSEAVSSEEAQNGGCNQICDNEPDIWLFEDLELQGITNWRGPPKNWRYRMRNTLCNRRIHLEQFQWYNGWNGLEFDLSDAGMILPQWRYLQTYVVLQTKQTNISITP